MTFEYANLSRRCPCGECDTAIVEGRNSLPTWEEAFESMRLGAQAVLEGKI